MIHLTTEPRRLTIDFMFIDLQTCGRCLGTEEALDAAVSTVRPVLDALGMRLEVNKILVESEEQAMDLAFQSSPTIRIAGRDIAGVLKETRCDACGDVCGEDTDCRVWIWRGQEYTAAPVGLIVEAILEMAVSHEAVAEPTGRAAVPANLKQFFGGKARLVALNDASAGTGGRPRATSACCGPAASESACGCQ